MTIDQSVTIDMVTGMAESRDGAVYLVGKYQDRRIADRALDMAWTHNSQVVLRQLNASEVDAQLHARLAGSVIYANAGMRADASVLIKNRRGQSALWGYAILGDLPIVLLQIADATNIALVSQLVQAHAYWPLKGLAVDLVIWDGDHAGVSSAVTRPDHGLDHLGYRDQCDRSTWRNFCTLSGTDFKRGSHLVSVGCACGNYGRPKIAGRTT